MRLIVAFTLACGATLSSAGAEPGLPLPVMSKPATENGWLGFSLLPKAFQRNPQLEMTVISEVTEFGRSRPLPSPGRPAYYIGHNSGYTTRGDFMGDHPPAANYLGKVLRRALEENGYQPADRTHAPALFLIFHWGTHNAMDREMSIMFPVLARRQVLERSILVGGRHFESSIARRLSFGDFLTDHSAKADFLTYQANDSLYFAVVSAYDVASFEKGQRRLVWRTSLTVNSRGVSMADSLPALILTGASSFGRDMKEPEIVLRRVRRGVVEYGPAQVIETDVPLPAPASPFSQSN